MLLAFIIFWLLREVRAILFWLYLWQLKEYHVGRFLAHFQTAKGQRLLLSPLVGAKVILLVIVFFVPNAIFLLIPLYVVVYIVEIFFRKSPTPVFTRKIQFFTIALLSLCLAFVLLQNFVLLLIFDIATPIFVSVVVLAAQPFAVLARNRIIRQAKDKREKFKNLKVIGITGSYGKTSTKEFLAHILSQKFQVLKTPEHQNSEVGVSNTILRSLTDEHDIFVCEMGAYNKGGIKLLADIVKPDMGIVTGVNEQHLATFGSMENLLSAEGGEELVGSLPQGGIVILNGASQKLKAQSSRLRQDYGGQAKLKKFIIAGEDIQASNINIEKERICFEVNGVPFAVQVYGGHNVQNLLLAIAAAKELGMSLGEIAKACEVITPNLGALKVKKGINGVTIIDSTYSANPDGVTADLEYLSLYEGKKILIMPCLIELGKASKDVHRRIGEKIGQICDLAIITTRECFADVKEGAGQAEKVVCTESAQEIFEKIKQVAKEGDAVLLEGGKESRVQRALLYLFFENVIS